MEIARRSRGTPRIANRMLRRVRDFAEVRADGVITREVADEALRALEIDRLGLDPIDYRMLRAIIENYGGGPVGIDTLAATIGEESVTLGTCTSRTSCSSASSRARRAALRDAQGV